MSHSDWQLPHQQPHRKGHSHGHCANEGTRRLAHPRSHNRWLTVRSHLGW